jgi:ABC-type lipoprotein release transport system permease subunit
LGIDPEAFSKRASFAFSSLQKQFKNGSPWDALMADAGNKTIFGFADQTVLDWGLKKKAGDTLKFRAENGEQYGVVIAGGLKSSIFQGYLLISEDNFKRLYPSVSGYSAFLIDCEAPYIETNLDLIRTRLEPYGVFAQKADEKLASFFTVTNTYLSVFTILGAFGILLGIAGLGLVLKNTYNRRRSEFAMLVAIGVSQERIRRLLYNEQAYILVAGLLTGIVSSVISTLATISTGAGLPWTSLIILVLALPLTGFTAIAASVSGIKTRKLVAELRNE